MDGSDNMDLTGNERIPLLPHVVVLDTNILVQLMHAGLLNDQFMGRLDTHFVVPNVAFDREASGPRQTGSGQRQEMLDRTSWDYLMGHFVRQDSFIQRAVLGEQDMAMAEHLYRTRNPDGERGNI